MNGPDFSQVSGREYLEALMAGEGAAPLGVLLGMRLVHVGEGTVTFTGKPDESHYNPQGTVHGGYAATMLDSAMGCAIHSRLGAGVGYSTIEIKINYVRAMTAASGEVLCHGEVVHLGKRLASATGRLEDAGGKLLAHGSTTCMIFA